MFDKLAATEDKYRAMEARMSDPALLADDSAHILLCNMEVVNDNALGVRLVNSYLDCRFVLYKRRGDSYQKLFHI